MHRKSHLTITTLITGVVLLITVTPSAHSATNLDAHGDRHEHVAGATHRAQGAAKQRHQTSKRRVGKRQMGKRQMG